MDHITPYIQTGLLIAALWLAIETMRLRRKTAEQLDYDREWNRNRNAPYLALSVRINSEGKFEGVGARNVSANLAVNGIGFLYDRGNHNFIKNLGVRPYIPPGAGESFSPFESVRFDLNGLTQEIRRLLPELDVARARKQIENALNSEPARSILVYIVHDSMRDAYIWFRVFEIDGTKPHYKASVFANHPISLGRAKPGPRGS